MSETFAHTYILGGAKVIYHFKKLNICFIKRIKKYLSQSDLFSLLEIISNIISSK